MIKISYWQGVHSEKVKGHMEAKAGELRSALILFAQHNLRKCAFP